jgi:phosphoribosylcarboxyaminoimidazole (NCAIR) mutase
MAILLSGTATLVCGAAAGAGGSADLVGFVCADTQITVAVSKATAAKKRAIFMTFL